MSSKCNEAVVRLISAKKQEPPFLLDWRLKAYRHWQSMQVPEWSSVHYPPIDYNAISYYSSPKSRKDAPASLEEVDPKLLETYAKLGIPLEEPELDAMDFLTLVKSGEPELAQELEQRGYGWLTEATAGAIP